MYVAKIQHSFGEEKFGDIRFYVQLLLERGFLSEACFVVENFFIDCFTVFSKEGIESSGRYCSIPYNIVDRLLSSCDKVLQNNAAGQMTNIQQYNDRLQISKGRLESAIERYFSLLS
jgi:hypothetical protein